MNTKIYLYIAVCAGVSFLIRELPLTLIPSPTQRSCSTASAVAWATAASRISRKYHACASRLSSKIGIPS